MEPDKHSATLARRCATGFVTMVALLSLGAAQPVPLAAAAKPNMIVFYLDDVAPHDGRLWNDASRMPAIYNTFVAHGIHFTHAYARTRCAARAGRAS